MARAPTDIRSLARSHTNLAIKVLAGIAKDGTNEGARVAAAVALLDRGWGKAEQGHELNADIQITIRTLLDPPPRPIEIKGEVIEHEAGGD
jgi:hypothetical protein